MKPSRILLLLAALAMLSGCVSTTQNTEEVQAPYRSLWAQLYPETLTRAAADEGSLQGRFMSAARSDTPEQSKLLWRQLLKEFDPADGFFEDAMHAHLVKWAKMEMVRLQYRLENNLAAEREQSAQMRQYAKSIENN